MLKQIIGVKLDGTVGPEIAWQSNADGFTAAYGPPTKFLTIRFNDLPSGITLEDHGLFTFVTCADAVPAWINTYRLSEPWRMWTVDAMRFAGYQWYANYIVPFVAADHVLVLFGRGENAFTEAGITTIYDHATYEKEIRASLRSGVRLIAEEIDGVATLTAQLLEPGGADSVRSDVTLYWETTGGYFQTTRTKTSNGQAVARLKDYSKPCTVKVGFRHFPAKAEYQL